jgi:hypothetical protein
MQIHHMRLAAHLLTELSATHSQQNENHLLNYKWNFGS